MHRLQDEFNAIREVSNLTVEQLTLRVDELNSLCQRELANQPTRLEFTICRMPPPHLFLLWKAMVKIECRKLEASTGRTLSVRLLSLRQLMSLSRDLCSYSLLPAASGGGSGARAASELTASVVLQLLPSDDDSESAAGNSMKPTAVAGSDVEECCICMDSQADVLLACAHAYCQTCIQRWLQQQQGTSNAAATNDATCPLCRSHVSGENSWIIASAPEVNQFDAAELMLNAVDRIGHPVPKYSQNH